MVELFTMSTVHKQLFTSVLFMVGTVHAGTVHENYFLDFSFVTRVRARANNVFKENVNNREIW